MKNTGILTVAMTALFVLSLSVPALGGHAEFRDDFTKAFEEGSRMKMEHYVEVHLKDVPVAINKVVAEARAAPKEERGEMLFLAERMAEFYKEKTGEVGELRMVKQAIFDDRVSKPVASKAAGGVHVVEMPKPTEEVKNFFAPDNIIIKRGDKVRWVNTDNIMHIFASMTFICKGGIFSPNVEEGESWEYTFTEAGEYYYICFIHNSMIGKITVVVD